MWPTELGGQRRGNGCIAPWGRNARDHDGHLYVHLIGADEDPEYTGIMEEVNCAEKGL